MEWIITALTLGLLIVAIVGESRRTPKSRVQYVVSDLRRVVTVPSGTQIAVSIAGREVQHAFSVRVRIANTGKASFPPSAWQGPLTIEMGDKVEVLQARLTGVRPVGAALFPQKLQHRVDIQPFLLNSGDLVEFTLVCDGEPTVPVVHARIEGLTEVKHRRVPYNPGTGPDGSMQREDKVINYAVFPVLFGALAIFIWFGSGPEIYSKLAAVGSLVFVMSAFMLWHRRAVRLNKVWIPTSRSM